MSKRARVFSFGFLAALVVLFAFGAYHYNQPKSSHKTEMMSLKAMPIPKISNVALSYTVNPNTGEEKLSAMAYEPTSPNRWLPCDPSLCGELKIDKTGKYPLVIMHLPKGSVMVNGFFDYQSKNNSLNVTGPWDGKAVPMTQQVKLGSFDSVAVKLASVNANVYVPGIPLPEDSMK